jgi:hypothetical protein
VFYDLQDDKATNLMLEKNFFSSWFWENWTSTCRRLKPDPRLTLAKIHSKMDLNARPETARGEYFKI